MSIRVRVWTTAAAAVLTACGDHPDPAPASGKAAETATKDPAAPGDQETTPGGVAGETAATPPGTEPETQTPGE